MDHILLTQIVISLATLFASLGGYFLAGMNERRRDERNHFRNFELRNFERVADLENTSHAFQRETLLSLQDALQKVARLTGKVMHFDHMQAREGKYTQLPEGLSDQVFIAEVEVHRLVSRILDPELRAKVRDFTNLSVRLSMLPSDLQGLDGRDLEYRSDAKIREFGEGYNAVTEVVGDALRREIAWRPEIQKDAGFKDQFSK